MSNRLKIIDLTKTLFSSLNANVNINSTSNSSAKNELNLTPRRLGTSMSWSKLQMMQIESSNSNTSSSSTLSSSTNMTQISCPRNTNNHHQIPVPQNPPIVPRITMAMAKGMTVENQYHHQNQNQRKILHGVDIGSGNGSGSSSLSNGSSSRSVVTQTQTKMEHQHVSSPVSVSAAVVSSLADDPKLLSKEDRNDFMAVFQELVRELTESSEYRDMPETNRWLGRVLQFNVPHGKRNRGLATALAYRYLTPELHEDNVKLSYVLGWTVEMLQAFFLVADDIMDGSETRRGHPCWYKIDNIGSAAFNDAILLESSIYAILKKYFRNKDYYVDLLDIMHDATHKTIYGQSLDTRTGYMRQMETYTLEKYNAIVKYKTSYYSFYLPVALAMAMARINDPELIRQAKLVTLEMGHFFQVQDDYLDCFGDTEVTGKIGTDIQDCKCSWLFVTALQTANTNQRQTLLQNYGQDEPAKIETIKNLYADMKIPELYHLYEESTYNMIRTHIIQMSPGLPKQLFNEMLAKIYRRSS